MELKPIPSIAFLSTIFLFLLSSTRTAENPQDLSSFYEVLKHYDLPPGLLAGIKEYRLNDDTGKFKVRLKQKCKFRCGEVHLKYKRKIKGHIRKGELTHLKGIKVKKHDDWERIKRICRSRRRDDHDYDHNSNNNSTQIIYTHDNNSNINVNSTTVDKKKKHDYVLFMGKDVTFRFPAKRFNRCPTCVNHDPTLT